MELHCGIDKTFILMSQAAVFEDLAVYARRAGLDLSYYQWLRWISI